MRQTTAQGVAGAPTTGVEGAWQRHLPARYAAEALTGRRGDGRWGTRTGYPVLYLGRPRDSVIIEAYRRLRDPVEDDMPASVFVPRVLVTARVNVTDILDLRQPKGRAAAGIVLSDLRSATTDVESYGRCRTVSEVAHQLGLHGVIAPAATGRGQTLAPFTDRLPLVDWPVWVTEEQWTELPPDPRVEHQRHLRLI